MVYELLYICDVIDTKLFNHHSIFISVTYHHQLNRLVRLRI